ncbi:MAG: hypothetical protein ABIA97_06895 [Candidatus Omnitrophota bacterium]
MSKICTSCGYIGSSVRITKGNILIEIFLWLLVIFPGVIYSIWRLTSKYDACPKCNNPTMIPFDSPVGQKLSKETLKDLENKQDFRGITKEEALRLWKANPNDKRTWGMVVGDWEKANKNE